MADLPHDFDRQGWIAREPRGLAKRKEVLMLVELPRQLDIAQALRAAIGYIGGETMTPVQSRNRVAGPGYALTMIDLMAEKFELMLAESVCLGQLHFDGIRE